MAILHTSWSNKPKFKAPKEKQKKLQLPKYKVVVKKPVENSENKE